MSKHLLLLNADGSTEETAGYAPSTSYTVMLWADGWAEQTDGSYAQTVTLSGVLATNRAIVDIDMSSATPSTYSALLEAWLLVGRAYTIENGITFVCFEGSPGSDISVNVEVL